jgi:cytochrome c oxidase subunit 3
MRRDYYSDLDPEIRIKTKKNLVYVTIFSIVMLFAGLTSAYIVSMGDSFWVKYPLPNAFYISTAVIVLSSLFLEFGIRSVKKGKQSTLKLFVALTFILGVAFVVFQFRGYKDLMDKGAYAVNNHIVTTEGRYGDYYMVKYKGTFVDVNGNDFLINGKNMTEAEMSQYQNFMSQFLKIERNKIPNIGNYGKDFSLYYNNEPLSLINKELTSPSGKKLEYVDLLRLKDLAENVKLGRGDFFHRGKYGEDFSIFFKGKELEYKERNLVFEGKKLDKFLQIKAMETADTATSYLYIITFLHLLHVLVTLIYMLRMVIFSFSGRFTSEEHLSLRLGAIFWHFLGLLWVYLLLFLLFIH